MAIDWDSLVLAPLIGVFGEPNDAVSGDLRPVYTPAGGSPFPVDGVFDDGFTQKVLLEDGAPGFVTSDPVLGVRVAEFAAQSPPVTPAQNDQVLIPRTGATYIVNTAQPDSHGWILLQLNLKST